MVASHFAAWVDFLAFATRPPADAARLVEGVIGYSHIVEGRLRGKGVLLLTAHLGNWEIGGLMLAQMKQPIHVVLVPDIFPGVERQRRRLHEACGVVEIRVDRSFVPTLAVLRVLSQNGIVAMQGDRDFDNTGVAMRFFGREAYFPRGPLRVAMASGATVLPAFIVRMPDGRYRAIVEEPLLVESGEDRDLSLRRNLERYVAILERYVGQYPDQWYCFFPFWTIPRARSRETPRRVCARRPRRRRTPRSASRAPRRRAGSPASRSPPPETRAASSRASGSRGWAGSPRRWRRP